jgi:hypothetical protein
MLVMNTDKLQMIGLCASLIAVVGLGSSILSGNELGLGGSVSITHKKALLLVASVIALRALYLRARHVRVRRSLGGNRGLSQRGTAKETGKRR